MPRSTRGNLIETPLRPADLLFVFGTRVDVDKRVDEADTLETIRKIYAAQSGVESVEPARGTG